MKKIIFTFFVYNTFKHEIFHYTAIYMFILA